MHRVGSAVLGISPVTYSQIAALLKLSKGLTAFGIFGRGLLSSVFLLVLLWQCWVAELCAGAVPRAEEPQQGLPGLDPALQLGKIFQIHGRHLPPSSP